MPQIDCQHPSLPLVAAECFVTRRGNDANDCFHTVSLTGLKPGTKYYFRLTKHTPLDEAPLLFLIASTRSAPREIYVAPDGNDHNSGLSRKQTWWRS